MVLQLWNMAKVEKLLPGKDGIAAVEHGESGEITSR